MALKILGDRVMIRVDEAPETEGGVILPETAQEKPQRGTIVAVGEGRKLDNGEIVPPDVEEGDTVIFAKYGGTDINEDGEDYKILDASQIYAKIV